MTRFGTEERNVARLSIVLCLNRIPAAMIGWTKQLQLDQISKIDVTCRAGRNHVVPHGLDGDILFALTTLYYLQGKPEYGRITVSVQDLCAAAGLKAGGNTFQRVRESLERWLHVKYQVADCWGSPTKSGKWNFRSLKFGIVNSVQQVDLDIDDSEPLGLFQANTLLQITLSPELIESMAAGHIRTVDLEFYASLKAPLSRILYRTLEEQRALLNQDSSRYSIPVSIWGDHLGLRTLAGTEQVPPVEVIKQPASLDGHIMDWVPVTEVMSATKIRRALTPAHEELQERGYLKTADYVGRGSDQRLDYVFGVPTKPVDLELVALLTLRHINAKQAEHHARTYSREQIETAAMKYDTRRANGYTPRNPGGFMTDILEHPEKYPVAEREEATKRVLNSNRVSALPEPEVVAPVRDAKSAVMALGRSFDENNRMRELRKRVVALYLQGQVETTDLMNLSREDVTKIEQMIGGWENRGTERD